MQDLVAPRIDYAAPQHVRDAVAALGRTEDVRFSPSNRRLAVAGFLNGQISIFDVSIATSGGRKNIALTGVVEISSPHLRHPHGVDFIDEDTIVVANREGEACVFTLPAGATGRYELEPSTMIRSDDISSPGSVAVLRNGHNSCDALICNNYVHKVTRHRLEPGARSSTRDTILLGKWLDIPDSICVSKDARWIAVSNHNSHKIFLYENDPSLDASCRPDGILRSSYPHGVRFTADGRFIFGACAGSPYINVYERGAAAWRGVRSPLTSFRVLDKDDFLRGQDGRRADGGAKGIDIDNGTNVLVTTCEAQPLAFFDVAAILDGARNRQRTQLRANNPDDRSSNGWLRVVSAAQVGCELYLRQTAGAVARWALTNIAPLSRLRNRITGLT